MGNIFQIFVKGSIYDITVVWKFETWLDKTRIPQMKHKIEQHDSIFN